MPTAEVCDRLGDLQVRDGGNGQRCRVGRIREVSFPFTRYGLSLCLTAIGSGRFDLEACLQGHRSAAWNRLQRARVLGRPL